MHDSQPVPVPDRLRAWLATAVQTEASDLHLTAGYPPALRLHGDLSELREPALSGPALDEILSALGGPDVQAHLREERDADFSFDLDLGGRIARFRAHLFVAGGHLAASLRVVP
ncbi:MAG: hypothetical protein J2P46_12190, partial [Zavarzinella sp.]|nr:hypothetical protein [Zavarzinella sp.]